MSDLTINGLTLSENLDDDDIIPFWKSSIGATRGIKKKNMVFLSGGGGANPRRCICFAMYGNNKKSLLFKAGTTFLVPSGALIVPMTFATDTVIDLTAQITAAAAADTARTGQENGKVFNLYATSERTIVVSVRTDAPSDISPSFTEENTLWVGCFSTLCVSIPAGTTGIVPLARNSYAVGNDYVIKAPYIGDKYGFERFYTKSLTAVSSGAQYDVGTVQHTLAGWDAGDILPESVWALGFMPRARSAVSMNNVMGAVFDPDTVVADDIYLQSGMGRNTASVYGATHTVSRPQQNHEDDMRQVGKFLLNDEEFASAALGSNERTSIQGAADQTSVGGHVDTAGRRMVSFLGCEEMCGYLWQWTRDVSANGGSGSATYDGQASFGQTYGAAYALLAGGNWNGSSSCGSRARYGSSARSAVHAFIGGRGASHVEIA